MRSDARSEPALGSLIPSDAVISARRIGTAQRCFCSSLPNDNSEARNDIHALRVEAVVDPAPATVPPGRRTAERPSRCGRRIPAADWAAASRCRTAAAASRRAHCRHVRHRPGPLQRFACGRQILVEERRKLRPKRLDVGIKSQLHGTPPRSAPDARRRRRATARPLWRA